MSRDNHDHDYPKPEEGLIPNVSETPSLYEQVISGGLWVFALRFMGKSLRFIRLIILARLLAPNDFGLFGIALLSMSCLERFSETGFEQALIQKKQDISRYLDTAWTAQLIRAAILAVILFIAAPAIGLFFNNSQAIALIRAMALAILFSGLINIRVVYFKKELRFNRQFAYQGAGIIAEFIVGVTLAVILRNVWALIFGLLANYLVTLLASYIIYPAWPRLTLDLKKFKELFGFGKWVLGSSILIFLVTQGDDIFVGKLLGIAALGFYQLAYRISNMPATEITHVISQVTLPAYSKLQDNIQKLREAYLKVLQVTAFLVFPIAGLIFILAPDFTRIFLGEKWMPMVPAMQILVFAGLLRSIAATPGKIFHAIGRPGIDTKLQIIRLSVLFALIYPLTVKWGISGASIAVLLSILTANIGFSFMAMKVTRCKINKFSKMIIFPMISAAIMVLSMLIFMRYIHMAEIPKFLLLMPLGIFIYLGATCLLDRFLNYGMRPLIKRYCNKLQDRRSTAALKM